MAVWGYSPRPLLVTLCVGRVVKPMRSRRLVLSSLIVVLTSIAMRAVAVAPSRFCRVRLRAPLGKPLPAVAFRGNARARCSVRGQFPRG